MGNAFKAAKFAAALFTFWLAQAGSTALANLNYPPSCIQSGNIFADQNCKPMEVTPWKFPPLELQSRTPASK